MSRRAVGLVVVLAVAWGGLAGAIALGLTPRLGLDLQGGTAVVLTAPEGTAPEVLEVSVEIMTQRIEGLGQVQEPDIAISGDDTVVVQLPGVEDEQRAIEAVGQTGQLSFRPVLGSTPGDLGPLAPDAETDTETDSESVVTIPEGEHTEFVVTIPEDETAPEDETVPDETAPEVDETAPEDETLPYTEDTVPEVDETAPQDETTVPEDETAPEDETTVPEDETTVPEDETTVPEDETAPGPTDPNIDPVTGLSIEDDIDAESYLLYDDGFAPVVLLVGPAALEGAGVANAAPVFDQGSGSWGVNLDLTSEGGEAFARVTAEAAAHPGGDPRRQIAIVLDGEVVSAPAVNFDVSPDVGITGGSALITVGGGGEAQTEAQDLALILRYGSLPVEFDVSSVQKVSGTLGADSLEAGVTAGLLGLILVAVALLAIYRSLGLVAVVGLTVFGSLLIAVFGLLGAWQGLTLTLAGVTGIIVSVGITTDSYIVYFERLKEKLREGLSVEKAAEEGFRLAYRTIWAADTVSLLAAILLWMLAVGAVKGFAIALLTATILDLLIAPLYTKRATLILARSRLGSGGPMSVEGVGR